MLSPFFDNCDCDIPIYFGFSGAFEDRICVQIASLSGHCLLVAFFTSFRK